MSLRVPTKADVKDEARLLDVLRGLYDAIGGNRYSLTQITNRIVNIEGAASDANTWLSQPNAGFPSGVNMGALGTGVLQQTVAAGVSTPQAKFLDAAAVLFGGGDGLIDTDVTGLKYVKSTQRLGLRLGANAPTFAAHVVDESGASDRGLALGAHYAGALGSVVTLQKSRGTFAAPTTVVAGDYVGRMQWMPYAATSGYITAVQMGAHVPADATVTGTSVPSEFYIYRTSTGVTTDPFASNSTLPFRINSLNEVQIALPANGAPAGAPLAIGSSVSSIVQANANASSSPITGMLNLVFAGRGTAASRAALTAGSLVVSERWYAYTAPTAATAGLYTTVHAEAVAADQSPMTYKIHPVTSATAGTDPLAFQTQPAFYVDSHANVGVGNHIGLATNATDGFLWLPKMAGVPSATPTGLVTAYTAVTGAWSMAPLTLDTTHDRIYLYNTSWKPIGQYVTSGMLAADASGIYNPRTITGTATRISVTNGDGVSGNPTIDMIATAVTPGSYTNTNLTVDDYGRITAASNGSAGGGGTVTSVSGTLPISVATGTTTPVISINYDSSLALSGSNLQRAALTGDATASAGSNALTLATVNASPGTYANATVTVNAKGLATLVVAGTAPAPSNATYITQTPDATLSAEQALSLLSSGVMHSVTATGVVSTFAVTSSRVTFGSGSNGAITDSANLTFGSNTLTVTGTTPIVLGAGVTGVKTSMRDPDTSATAAQSVWYPASGTNVAQAFGFSPRGTGADATHKAQFNLFNTDYIADSTNYELMVVRSAGTRFIVASGKSGTGTARDIMFAGGWATDESTNNNQMQVKTDGTVRFGDGTTVGAPIVYSSAASSGTWRAFKDAAVTKGVSVGIGVPGAAPGNDLVFATFGGVSWSERGRFLDAGTLQVVSLAAGGMVKATAATGALGIGVAGTDYVAPGTTIATTFPIRIDGGASADLSANRTISIQGSIVSGSTTTTPQNLAALTTGLLKGTIAAGVSTISTAVSGTDYQPAGNYITALTGDGTATGPGSAAFTLANTGVAAGTYTYPVLTVDAKGRITAATTGFPSTLSWYTQANLYGQSGYLPTSGDTVTVNTVGYSPGVTVSLVVLTVYLLANPLTSGSVTIGIYSASLASTICSLTFNPGDPAGVYTTSGATGSASANDIYGLGVDELTATGVSNFAFSAMALLKNP